MKFLYSEYGFLFFFLAFATVFIGLEWLFLRITGRGRYGLQETMKSLMVFFAVMIFNILFRHFAGAAIGGFWRGSYLTWSLPPALTALAALLVTDFIFYWLHRLNHHLRLGWAGHSLHHSSEVFNLAAGLRNGYPNNIAISFLLFQPLGWLGFPVVYSVTSVMVLELYQFLLHTEFFRNLGWLERILTTPRQHRLHHGKDPRYHNCNYGGIFSICDHLFGTYLEVDPEFEIQYGVPEKPLSPGFLPFFFSGWIRLARDLAQSPGFKAKALLLLLPSKEKHEEAMADQDLGPGEGIAKPVPSRPLPSGEPWRSVRERPERIAQAP